VRGIAGSSDPSALQAPARKISLHGHIPQLDSLRGAAILLVVVYHAYGGSIDYRNWQGPLRYFLYLSRYGFTGVELFFVLSGFLITGILLKSQPRPDFYAHFYKRRALRILPAYFAILIAVKLWMGVTWKYILACLLYAANMAGIVGAKSSEYAPLWSLAVEEQFYLIWPFSTRRLKPETLFKLALGICIVSPFLRLAAATVSPTIDIRYKTYFIADYLAYGALIAIAIHLQKIDAQNIKAIARGMVFAGSALALAVMWVSYQPVHRLWVDLILRSMGVLPFVWLYAGLLLRGVYRYQTGDHRANRVLVFFGYISYGLYLIHEFLFYEYGKLAPHSRWTEIGSSVSAMNLRFAVVGGLAVLLAYLSRRFYEEYFLRLGKLDDDAGNALTSKP